MQLPEIQGLECLAMQKLQTSCRSVQYNRTTGSQAHLLRSPAPLPCEHSGSVRTQLTLMPPSLRQASTIKVAECCEGFIPVLSSCAAFLETNLTKKAKKNEKKNEKNDENE